MEEAVGPFTFSSNFESGNLARAERVDPPGSGHGSSHNSSNRKSHKGASSSSSTTTTTITTSSSSSSSSAPCQPSVDPLPVNYEYNLWTRPDCAGTEYENNNRTWFYFGIKGGSVGNRVRLNVMNLNKQTKLFSQGMQPVVQCVSSSRPPRWERIKEKCTYRSEESSTVISWVHTVSDSAVTTHYAFTYPYTYSEVQAVLEALDRRFPAGCSSLYYHRELLAYSLDRWRVDLLTISSNSGRAEEREDHLPGLFPMPSQPRPHRFPGKKVVFVSARVHPGETSSSFVLNGFLSFIVSGDPRAKRLRDLFVFKLIPLLNPDGVVRGHYRTDQRGVNLNRVYVDPSPVLHPTIYAARQIILYHHHGRLTPTTTTSTSTDTSPSLSDATDPSASTTTTSTATTTATTTSSESMDAECKGPGIVVMDEDTCHSFSDVQQGQAGGEGCGGQVRSMGVSLMELDEPSASGWDISNSVASTSTRGAASDLHDDCSNVSGVSEGETGVTAMFGSLSAVVSDFSNLIPSVPGGGGEAVIVPGGGSNKSRSLFLKDFHKEESECAFLGCFPDRPREGTNKSVSVSSNPFSGVGESSQCASQREQSVGAAEKNLRSVVSKRDLQHKTLLKIGSPSTPGPGQGCGVASSSESEAECGRPGRESDVVAAGPLPLATDPFSQSLPPPTPVPEETKVPSGLYLYVDLHGHASKKGIFIYGNWYEDPAVMVENMLFPKLLAINCPNFDFSACNFSERNMYLKDRRDGMSKEGSGRVAIMRATGLLRSYTLECNYNTGRTHNPTPPSPLDHRKHTHQSPLSSPPKYTPAVFDDCGRQLGVSLLDVGGGGCEWSRVPQSQYGSLAGVRTWLHHFLVSSALSPRNQTSGQQTPRAYTSRTPNKLSVERISGVRTAGSGPRLGPNRPGPPSTPSSPRLPRTRGQRVRRHSWCLTVDAENQEPREAPEGPARPRPSSAKKAPSTMSPRCKPKAAKLKTPPPIKTGVSRSLTFTELGESSHISAENKMVTSKITSSKHSLTASVSLTPNLNVKLSISDTPESPKLVKKVEKMRRQRSKGLASGTKKLKVCPSSSSSTDESSLRPKDSSFYSLPSLETTDRKCNPLSPSQEGFYGSSQGPLSPRSPLSSVCEPQASQSTPGLSIITTAASCDLYVQPKSPAVVCSTKKLAKVLSSPSKRSSKHSLKSLSKSMDRLPAVAGAAGERLKLLPKKVKKVSARSVTDLPGSITSKPIKPATSQPALGWIISEPPQTRPPDVEPDPPKLKKRKKTTRKSL